MADGTLGPPHLRRTSESSSASAARPIPRRTDSSATSSASGTPSATSFSPPHASGAAGFGSLTAIEEAATRVNDGDYDDVPVPMGTPIPPLASGWFGKGTTVRNSSGKGSRRGSGGKAASPAGRPAAAGRAAGKLPPPQSAARQEAPPHLPGHRQQAELEAGLRTGRFFKAKLRFDARSNGKEAYATLPGVPVDFFIEGPEAVKRAVEGDEVALRVFAPEQWAHLKNGTLPCSADFAPAATVQFTGVPRPSPGNPGQLQWTMTPAHALPVSESDGLAPRLRARSTPVPSIKEGILDNDAIEEGDEEGEDTSSASETGGLDFDMEDDGDGSNRRSTGAAADQPGWAALRMAHAAPNARTADAAKLDAARIKSLSAFLGDSLSLGRALSTPIADPPQLTVGGPGSTSSGSGTRRAGGAQRMSSSWEGTADWSGLERMQSGGAGSRAVSARFATVSASSVSSVRSLEALSEVSERLEEVDGSAQDVADDGYRELPWGAASTPAAVAEVVARILAIDDQLRPKAEVVGILKPSRLRTAVVGVLRSSRSDNGSGTVLLQPRNPRLPQMVVSLDALDMGQQADLRREASQIDQSSGRLLVCASMDGWEVDQRLPAGKVLSVMGPAGDLDVERMALLAAENAPNDGFAPEVLAELPALRSLADDLDGRMDLRGKCVFTIDPEGARDLDDALSVTANADGTFDAAVHIADVGHFVRPSTALDKAAQDRGTSIYLVDRVIPMLPRMLCEELCSLTAGVDHLTFSIGWHLDGDGNVLYSWASPSVIRSCAKLRYSDAQKVLEDDALPQPSDVSIHGDHAWQSVAADVRHLHGLAQRMRARRTAGGSLRLDNVKLGFKLDDAGQPTSSYTQEQREANQLVEEFMLLANRTAATRIAETYPDRALLRRHPPPVQHGRNGLEAAVKLLESMGLEVDASSPGSLQTSLRQLAADRAHEPHVLAIAQMALTRPMQMALYFGTGDLPEPEWRHWALGMPRYTHFTSPIRRYPDVIVHRQLLAAVMLKAPDAVRGRFAAQLLPKLLHAEELRLVAEHCNDRKCAAKSIQASNTRLYLTAMLQKQPVVTHCFVSSLNGHLWFDVYCPVYGIECRLYNADVGVNAGWDVLNRTVTLSRRGPGRPPATRPKQTDPPPQPPPNSVIQIRDGLVPTALPLQLRLLSCLPVLLYAALDTQAPQCGLTIYGRLWVSDRKS